MTFIILGSAFIIVLIGLYFTSRSAEKPNGNILIGVTLPREHHTNPEVLLIVKAYHKANLLCLFASLLGMLAAYFLRAYISIILLYLIVFTFFMFFAFNKVFTKYFNQLYALKKQNQWFVGSTHVVSVDTEVSRIKNTFPVSSLWFIPAAVISLIPLLFSRLNGTLFILQIFTVLFVAICYLVYRMICKDRTITYSENSEISMALNSVYKKEWSRFWVITACFMSCWGGVISFVQANQRGSTVYFVIACLVSFIPTILYMVCVYTKIRNTRNRLLALDNASVCDDEDAFWEKGYYYNPNDSRTMVEKRVGIVT